MYQYNNIILCFKRTISLNHYNNNIIYIYKRIVFVNTCNAFSCVEHNVMLKTQKKRNQIGVVENIIM